MKQDIFLQNIIDEIRDIELDFDDIAEYLSEIFNRVCNEKVMKVDFRISKGIINVSTLNLKTYTLTNFIIDVSKRKIKFT